MKAKPIIRSFVFLALLASVTIPARSANLVTFDDLSETGTGSFIPSGYDGLNWNNFVAKNSFLYTVGHGLSGYYYGMVSASNVVYNSGGFQAEVDSTGTNFNFLSAYLTGAWNSNLNIEVQGFSGTNLLYDQTVVAAATAPTQFTFNYMNIDRLTFTSSGGQNAGFPEGAGSTILAMDNMSIEFVPEPATVLLTALGALTLVVFIRRRPT